MKIELFQNINSEKWNKLCNTSEYAWLFHRYEWIEIESKFFADRNLSFCIIKENELVALQPLYIRKIHLGLFTELIIDSGIHRHTGLAVKNNLSPSDIKTIRSLSMNYIFQLADKYDVDRIQLNSHNLAPINLSNKREEIPFWVRDYGFNLGLNFTELGFTPAPGMSSCNADQIIDLKKDELALYNALEDSCKRAIKKAQKNNLIFVVADKNINAIQEYYELAKLSATRTKESLPPKEFYLEVYNKFSLSGNAIIIFALHKKVKVGAIFLLTYKNSVNFMAGISHPDYLSMRVNDFLHWSAITWAKKEGFLYYRLGPIFPELPKYWPIYKQSRFKKKFGGKCFLIIQGSYFRKPSKYFELGIKSLELRCKSIDKNV